MKKWYLSRTIWLGFLTVAAAGVAALAEGLRWEQALLAVIGAANVVLRTQTDTPIGKLKP